MPKSSDMPRYSVLADASFLTEPSNAQVLRKQQLDSVAESDTKKYLLVAGLVAAGLVAFFALKK